METLSKIEIAINKLLHRFFSFIGKHLSKMVPKKISSLRTNIKEKTASRSPKNIKTKCNNYLTYALKTLEKTKQRILTAISFFKNLDFKEIKIGQSLMLVFSILTPIIAKIYSWYLSVKRSTIVYTGIISITAILSGMTIYYISNDMYEKTKTKKIIVVEKDLRTKKRSDYYKYTEKMVVLTNISFPIYNRDVRAPQTFTIDVKVTATNRFIPHFLKKHEHMIRDHIYTNTEQMNAKFVMSAEGKNILKGKIKREINTVIKDQKVAGEIEQVNIIYNLTD